MQELRVEEIVGYTSKQINDLMKGKQVHQLYRDSRQLFSETNMTTFYRKVLELLLREYSVDLVSAKIDCSTTEKGRKGTANYQQIGDTEYYVNTSTNTGMKYFNLLKVFREIDDNKRGLYSFVVGRKGETLGGEDDTEEELQERIEDLIDNGCRQMIFTGAPGTGKTYLAKKIAGERGGALTWKKDGTAAYEFVQFHPSYDYTDFVEGIRPIRPTGTEKKDIQFAKLDGVFKSFCRNVIRAGNSEQLYFFIIDEINRADLSKVFGELMYCLEKDKRGEKNKINTQYRNLPTYGIEGEDEFADGFYIPENVVVIGTMNDIDRSVESMDFALRRRFEWIEYIVDNGMLVQAFQAENEKGEPVYGDVICAYAEEIAERVMALNHVICCRNPAQENDNLGAQYGLNRQYYISQGQFANLPVSVWQGQTENEIAAVLDYVWKYRIRSLLREYLRGEDEADVEQLLEICRERFRMESAPKADGSKDTENTAQ